MITKAKSDNIETAGVSGGGKIAEYLSKGDEKSAVLESLVQEIKPPPPREPAEPLPEQKEETVDRKLEQLTEEPKSAAPEPETPQAKPDEKLKEADAKLNDILGNRK